MTNSTDHSFDLRTAAAQLNGDVSPALQILVAADGRLLAMNQTGQRFVGGPEPAGWADLLADSDLSRWQQLLTTAAGQQVPLSGEFRLRRFDKALRRFILRAEQRYSQSGGFDGLMVSGMDISDLSTPNTVLDVRPTAPDAGSVAWTQEALRWHDELVSVATVVAGCGDVLCTLLQDSKRDDVQEVLARLQAATEILRSTVTELGARGRRSVGEVYHAEDRPGPSTAAASRRPTAAGLAARDR